MTALIQERATPTERWTRKQFALAVGNKAWKNGKVVLNLATGKVVPGGAVGTNFLDIGRFAETVDATAVEKLVDVHLGREIEIERWANSGTNPLLATDVGSLCYVEDDQTVTKAPTGKVVAGRVWDVDATRGVAVERLAGVGANEHSSELVESDPGAFVAGDLVIPANPASGALYDIPATAAVSTVTLPALAVEGTVLHFVADGAKNGHTVQYRDASGPVLLTTALLALKRHQVTAIYLNGKWTANAYTAP